MCASRQRTAAGRDRLAADIARVVAQALRVPSRYREYREDAHQALRVHGLSAETLTALLDGGLPHRRSAGRVLMDPRDLSNASFQLRLPSPRAMAMRGWANALRDARSNPGLDRTVTVDPVCPQVGHPGECRFEIAFDGPPRQLRPPGNVVRPAAVGRSRLLPADMHWLTDRLSSVELYLLPKKMSEDFGFVRETGLADCPLAAAFVAHEAAEAGLTARRSFGILLARPYAILHMWTELWVDAAWLAVDPLLISTLTGRGLLDHTDWPPFRSLGDAVWRLGPALQPLVLHNGAGCRYAMSTQVVSTPIREAGVG